MCNKWVFFFFYVALWMKIVLVIKNLLKQGFRPVVWIWWGWSKTRMCSLLKLNQEINESRLKTSRAGWWRVQAVLCPWTRPSEFPAAFGCHPSFCATFFASAESLHLFTHCDRVPAVSRKWEFWKHYSLHTHTHTFPDHRLQAEDV